MANPDNWQGQAEAERRGADFQPTAAAQAETSASTRAATRAMLKMARKVWLTNAIILIAIAVSIITALGSKDISLLTIASTNGGLDQITHGELWRLITPIFLHFSIVHIVCNCYAMFFLGGAIELRRGRLFLIALVLVSAAYSNVAQLLVGGNIWFGGLSGVVFALFGYLWIAGHFSPNPNHRLPPRFIKMALISFFICFPVSWLGYPIANTAHAAGLIAGMIWGYVDSQTMSRR